MTETMIVPPPEAAKPTMMSIAKDVATAYDLTVDDLITHSRVRRVSHPRQEAMYLMRQVTWPDGTPRYSLTHIGQFFGKDHTTALFGIRAHMRRNNLNG
jgi:chromosomal replication initiation ATPase DnaA